MRIKNRTPESLLDVVTNKKLEKARFSTPRLSDDVHMPASIEAPDSERNHGVAVIRMSEERDLVVLRIRRESDRRRGFA
jgi:hypothetical protein